MTRTLIFILALFIIGLCSVDARACSCAGESAPCQQYWEASAVFIGTVIEGREVAIKEGDSGFHRRAVRISIDEAFRGVEGAEVEVLTGFGGGDCGFGFRRSAAVSRLRVIGLRVTKNCTPIFARARERSQKPIRISFTFADSAKQNPAARLEAKLFANAGMKQADRMVNRWPA